MKISHFFQCCVVLFSCNIFAYAATGSECATFLQCLSKNLSPTEDGSSFVYTPQNASFTSVLKAYIKDLRFDTLETPKPIFIVTALKEAHVQSTVVCAKTMGIQLKIRSGGHDYDGLSYVSKQTFIILDMFNLRKIDVNIATETAVVEAGATLGEVYYRIWEKSKVHGFPAGVCPTVGVGGHLSGGGYGNMLRKFGLSVDNMIDARIVNAKGEVLDRNSMGEDLFWAIRGGGGGSFGVILSYTIKLVKVPQIVTVFRVMRSLDENAIDLVHKYQLVIDKMDNDLFIRVLLQPVSGKNKGTKTIRASFIAMFLGDSNRLVNILKTGFPELGLKQSDCLEMSWIKSVMWWANFDINSTSEEQLLSRKSNVKFGKRKSDYVQTPIPKDGLELLAKKMIALGKAGLVFNSYGGKMSEIPTTAVAFPHRAGNIYKIQYSITWHESGLAAENNSLNQLRSLHEFMTPYVSKSPRGAYLNYRDVEIGTTDNGKNSYNEGKVYGESYFGPNFDRLVKVKTAVDPENFFRNEQSIPVMPSPRGRHAVLCLKHWIFGCVCFLLYVENMPRVT
ncbi:Berberine bridge enzyme [Heracleum sosnowskyi]|uniref:Berberine bridge enzyme n=1 Tax=Heracleum sosnowskyi TaxID=360622 RepID=A0AAD8MTS4_9APIA|nr:Berberine bridge enzyme [Heracleum sosnowskyi]